MCKEIIILVPFFDILSFNNSLRYIQAVFYFYIYFLGMIKFHIIDLKEFLKIFYLILKFSK